MQKNATTGTDGKTDLVEYYNLDVSISVGYRVKSSQATQYEMPALVVQRAEDIIFDG